jgi:DNA-binding IclR family transcriptional regulator
LLPAHRTSIGRALLAELPPSVLRTLYPRGVDGVIRNAKVTLVELEQQLRLVRRHGYARNDRESHANITAFGVALRDAFDRPVAAISVAVPPQRLEESAVPHLVTQLRTAAKAVHDDLMAA